MNEAQTFESFFGSIELKSLDDYQTTIDGVIKKLNQHYYASSSVEEHGYIVGSIGRETAVPGTSDVDLLFDLPTDEYKRYDNYETNGQSALLQTVKKVIEERYPRTDVKGDGQAVVIEFDYLPFSIDLVPAFKQSDSSFKYPDSNDGGSWKKTDPFPEQSACNDAQAGSGGWFRRLANATRVWKDNAGFHFKGLLIDTLVSHYIDDRGDVDSCHFDDSYDLICGLFKYLSQEDAAKSYWYAIGSNQLINNSDNGTFVSKAKQAHKKLSEAELAEEKEDAFTEIFGKPFSDNVADSVSKSCKLYELSNYEAVDTEEFIEQRFPVDILYDINLDCIVAQDGFRPASLVDMLRKHTPLLPSRSLRFKVTNCDVTQPYDLYWKVKNCGAEAYRRNCIRGQVKKACNELLEHTQFRGDHYVEVYAVRNGVCVARQKLRVPITEKV